MADTFIDDLDWLPDELITSTKFNQWWANMQNFHNGTALGDGIIVTRHVAADAIGSSQLNPAITTDANGWSIFDLGSVKRYWRKMTGSSVSIPGPGGRQIYAITPPVGVNPTAANNITHVTLQVSQFAGHFSMSWEYGGGAINAYITNIYNGGSLATTPTFHLEIIVPQ